MKELSRFGTLLGRELLGELRSREVFTATVVFPPLMLVIFKFSLDLGEVGKVVDWPTLVPGIVWTAWAFAGVLCVSRSFAAEMEDGKWQGLVLSPVDRGTLYLAKAAATMLYLLLVGAVTLPIVELFFEVGLFALWPRVVLASLLGIGGIAAVGTLLGAMAVNTRAREALLPLLMLPLLSPTLIAATQVTRSALTGVAFQEIQHWVVMMAAIDVLFLSLGWVLFEFIVED